MSRSDQVPTNSGFHGRSTGSEVLADVDLTGRTVIVTGGYSGIGLEATRALAEAGAHVVVAVRTPEKAADAGRHRRPGRHGTPGPLGPVLDERLRRPHG